MAAAGYDVARATRWALNELDDRGPPRRRQRAANVREFLRGL